MTDSIQFCPRCGAPKFTLTFGEANASTGWPLSPDTATVVSCNECGCQTRVTPATPDEQTSVEPWTPITDRVEAALADVRYNAHCLKRGEHQNTAEVLLELAEKIERHYRVIDDDRRERIYDATNRILEYARDRNDSGEPTEAYRQVEAAVDDILSTVGVPDRVVEE